MDDVMNFNPLLSPVLIISLLAPLTVFLLWMEARRTFRFRFLRIVSAGIMMLALAAILLRPSFTVDKPGDVLLLTPGFEKEKVDSVLALNPGLVVKHLTGVQPHVHSTIVRTSGELRNMADRIRFLAGYGLKEAELEHLRGKSFSHIPSALPEGITAISIPEKMVSNRHYPVEGIYNGTSAASKIILSGPGGREDSVTVKGKGLHAFHFSYLARRAGNIMYELIVTDSLGNQVIEKLPLKVAEAKPLNILFIQSYPTFETQYLKNFLAQKKHRLVLRYQLSKQAVRYEYANRPPVSMNAISRNTIKEFDVIVTDNDALEKLSPAERTIVLDEIENGGLGLLNLQGSFPKNLKPTDVFPFDVFRVKTDTTEIIRDTRRFILPAIPLRLSPAASVTELIKNKSGILTGYGYRGAGKIGFQFLKETYRLSLYGDSVAYSEIWTPLIEQIARPEQEPYSIDITSPFPRYPDEPLHLEVISSGQNPAVTHDSIKVPLKEDVLLDDVWHGTVWPGNSGWHWLNILPYYVSEDGEWKTLEIANRMNETRLIAATGDTSTPAGMIKEEREIPPLLFYTLFLLAAGFIWLAPKL